MSIYLGLDSSTQGLKAVLIDAKAGKIIAAESVIYSADLPEFKSVNGVLDNPDPLLKHSDPLMWVAALDLVMKKLQSSGVPLAKVAAVSGSGQQHGSVYLNKNFFNVISKLETGKSLAEQLKPVLSRKTSPIWMDSSTSRECEEITKLIGKERIQQLTGSFAIERFTGPQIRKFSKQNPLEYKNTARIHLVSSFISSIIAGTDSPIDYGDGAGMNLLNLQTLQWDGGIAEATASELIGRLPVVKPSGTAIGRVSSYFKKYGLNPEAVAVVWSGDNPCSLIGVGAAEAGTAVISLGTSDTFFAAMRDSHVDPQGCGHVFGNPAGGFMSLICFKNGSLAREKIKNDCGVDWDYFGTDAFLKTKPGNNGNLILPYFIPEITPLVLKAGPEYFGTEDFRKGEVDSSVKIRAVVESQALSMRLHSKWIGEDFKTIRVTGGASKSPGLCQVLADVFHAGIEKISVPDSAALGAAMRATNAHGKFAWKELNEKFAAPTEKIKPNQDSFKIYDEMLVKFMEFEKAVTKTRNL